MSNTDTQAAPAKLAISSFPIPEKRTHGPIGRKGSKYDLASLRPGTEDCIVLEVGPERTAKKAHSSLSSAIANARKAGDPGKYAIRSFDHKKEDGSTVRMVGVWRLE